jgi:murein DD-endopeptidase MepM/ murein hydrolase activator NlpD
MVQGAHTGGVIRGYNKGGRIDPRTPITRGIETRRREIPKPKPIIQPQKTAPGKDVGGDKKVKQLYDQTTGGIPDFIPLPSFFRSDKKSGFTALMGASEEYKKPMTNDILGIGNMMGASVDSALGQKIEKRSYTQFADGIKYLVNYGMTEPEEFAKIDLEEMVRKIVEPRVNMAINRIQEEINKKSTVEPEPGGGMGGEGGDIGTIDMDGFSPEDVDALGRMIHAESGSESALGKAGVLAVILNRYRLIKSGTAPSQFNISGKTSEQVTIRDILFAGGTGPGNQFSPYKDGSFERTSSAAGKSALAAAIQSGGNDPQKFKDNLISSGLSEADAEYVMRSVSFSNARTRSSRPFNTREVAVGNHVFQQSPNVRLSGQLGAIDATVQAFDAKLDPGKFMPISGTSGASMGSRPLSIPYSPFMSNRGNPVITSAFGWRWGRDHTGLDIGAAQGTPLYAYSPGTVTFSGKMGAYGFRIEWKDRNGFLHSFSHMAKRPRFRVGDSISQGQLLGEVGSTGRSTGPHLHWEIKQGGRYLDPVQWTRNNPLPRVIDQPPQTLTNRQAPRPPELQRILQTPKGSGYLVNNRMYYLDTTNGDLRDDKNKIISADSSEWRTVIPEIMIRMSIQDRQKLEAKLKETKEGQNNPLFGIIEGVQNIIKGPGVDNIKERLKRFMPKSDINLPNQEYASNNQTESLLADQAIRRKYGGLVYKNGNSPTLPSQKYSSYGSDQSPQIAIQPVIISNQVPVPVSSGAVPFAVPVISSSDIRLT